MAELVADPLENLSIAEFGDKLRQHDITAEAAAQGYLARIAQLEPALNAFTYVASEQALRAARGVDQLVSSGIDLGPLMGVPVAVKDLFTISGMPLPTVGSRVDVADLVQPEGTFIKKLKRAGCVILGKTRMTEFAFGLVNLKQRPPRNPWDSRVHRMPGGSSSGSAVALASGMCALSVGSDTGGSVRQPAALCGVVGFKETFDSWPLDGVFPLARSFDSIGFFTRSVSDAGVVYAALKEQTPPQAASLRGTRLGRPTSHYFSDLTPAVTRSIDAALLRLEKAGADIVPIEIPEVRETNEILLPIMAAELLAHLGRGRVEAAKEMLDPIVWSRLKAAFELPAVEYLRHLDRALILRGLVQNRMRGVDALICPTTFSPAVGVTECGTVDEAIAWTHKSTRNTRPGNLFGQCGISIPITCIGGELPVGLQVMCGPGEELKLLAISGGIEKLFPPLKPPLDDFVTVPA